MPAKQPSKPVETPIKKTSFKFADVATLGPLGYFPKGPGTIGSLVALPVAYGLSMISVHLLWLFVLVMFFVGLYATAAYTADKAEKDPHCVIIDEFVGQMIPFVIIIPDFFHWPIILMGFLLFRLFDIFKFGPMAAWDRRKTPLGVMMDDVSAGIFAAFVLSMMQVVMVEYFKL